MEIIFVEKVGNNKPGDVVAVKDGYARNFLLPQKLAVPASKENLEHMKEKIAEAETRHEELLKLLNDTKAKLEADTIEFERKSEQKDKLFGSVTSQDVWEALSEKGYPVEKHDVEVPEIKKVGSFKATVKLSSEVTATVKVEVKAEA